MGVYDLGLISDEFWKLTFGQIRALMQRKKVEFYLGRFDIASLYALTYNIASSDKKISVHDYLGDSPFESEKQKPEKIKTETFKEAFARIFPMGAEKKK